MPNNEPLSPTVGPLIQVEALQLAVTESGRIVLMLRTHGMVLQFSIGPNAAQGLLDDLPVCLETSAERKAIYANNPTGEQAGGAGDSPGDTSV
jgi:hypothetical protein